MHLGVELLQFLNETEEIRECFCMSPPLDKMCNATKAKVTKLCSAASAEEMNTSLTRTNVCKKSADSSRPSRCCSRREASNPPRVDVSTVP